MCYRSKFEAWAWLILLPFIALTPSGASSDKTQCKFESLRPALADLPEVSPKTLEELLHAFQEGALPVPGNRDHEVAFQLYRDSKFSKRGEKFPEDMDRIADILTKDPRLTKEPFRSIEIQSVSKTYARTEKLNHLVREFEENYRSVKSLLFRQTPDRKAWSKLKSSQKGEMKALLSDEDLQGLFDPEMKRHLGTSPLPYRTLQELWFKRLSSLLEKKRAQGIAAEPLEKLLSSLVHTARFHDESVYHKLSSDDGKVVLDGIRELLGARQDLAEHLGFELGYGQMLKSLGIEPKTGGLQGEALSRSLLEIEKEVLASAQELKGKERHRLVRQLSLYESPFRSCLGDDCATRTYFERALDPNYHYFTVTNPFTEDSSGHITVVLGTAKDGVQKVPVAFVDKIQNLSNEELPAVLEAVRRSVAEKGYVLAIPRALGNHNGLSNEGLTRNFIAGYPPYKNQRKQLKAFVPHPTKSPANFGNQGYSRAGRKLIVKPLLPFENKELAFFPRELPQWKRLGSINLPEITQATLALQHGSTKDKIAFLEGASVLKSAGLIEDSVLNGTLDSWLEDPLLPLTLKNRILTYTLLHATAYLGRRFEKLVASEKSNLIQNWLQTDRLKSRVLNWEHVLLPRLLDSPAATKRILASTQKKPNEIWDYLISSWTHLNRGALEFAQETNKTVFKTLVAVHQAETKEARRRVGPVEDFRSAMKRRLNETRESVHPDELALFYLDNPLSGQEFLPTDEKQLDRIGTSLARMRQELGRPLAVHDIPTHWPLLPYLYDKIAIDFLRDDKMRSAIISRFELNGVQPAFLKIFQSLLYHPRRPELFRLYNSLGIGTNPYPKFEDTVLSWLRGRSIDIEQLKTLDLSHAERNARIFPVIWPSLSHRAALRIVQKSEAPWYKNQSVRSHLDFDPSFQPEGLRTGRAYSWSEGTRTLVKDSVTDPGGRKKYLRLTKYLSRSSSETNLIEVPVGWNWDIVTVEAKGDTLAVIAATHNPDSRSHRLFLYDFRPPRFDPKLVVEKNLVTPLPAKAESPLISLLPSGETLFIDALGATLYKDFKPLFTLPVDPTTTEAALLPESRGGYFIVMNSEGPVQEITIISQSGKISTTKTRVKHALNWAYAERAELQTGISPEEIIWRKGETEIKRVAISENQPFSRSAVTPAGDVFNLDKEVLRHYPFASPRSPVAYPIPPKIGDIIHQTLTALHHQPVIIATQDNWLHWFNTETKEMTSHRFDGAIVKIHEISETEVDLEIQENPIFSEAKDQPIYLQRVRAPKPAW